MWGKICVFNPAKILADTEIPENHRYRYRSRYNFRSLLLDIFHECLLTRPNQNPIFVISMIPTKLCKSFDCLQILCCLVECTNTQILTGSD